MYFNIPELATREHFDHRDVPPSNHPVPLRQARAEATFPLSPAERERYSSLEEMLGRNATRAFLVVRDDALVYERYFGDVSRSTKLSSFSISKTYTALLVELAVQDGTLGSLGDSIVTYIPELARKPLYDRITLDELMRMTSGIGYREESVDGAAMYYSTNLHDRLYAYDVTRPPGTHYEYGSINVQLLWEAMHRRLHGLTVGDYFAERVWEPLGAEDAAEWSLDSKESGLEKSFGGFNATARDHARLGLLFLHGGSFNGQSIVPRSWVEAALAPDDVAGVVTTRDGQVRHSHYQWFLTRDGRCYFAKGYHGQYIFVVPDKASVFVRFGEGYGHIDWPALFERLADTMT